MTEEFREGDDVEKKTGKYEEKTEMLWAAEKKRYGQKIKKERKGKCIKRENKEVRKKPWKIEERQKKMWLREWDN